MDPQDFLARVDEGRVVAAIRAAESRCRGEIRVHVSREDAGDAHAAAVEAFERLGMTATAERNGVLIFIVPRERSLAVVGDRGVHERCGEGFWREAAAAMQAEFRQGRLTEGLIGAVERAGEVLARFFPREAGRDDVNELDDSISRD